MRSRTWLWLTIVDAALFQFAVLGSFYVLGPLVAEHALHSRSAWAVILAAFGLGAVIGGGAALRFHPQRPLVALHVVMLGVAPGLILLAVHAPTFLIASAEVLAGFAMGFGGTVWETTLQEKIRPEALSRVSAYDWMGSGALRPLGLIAAGPVAAAIGVRPTLLGAAAVLLGTSGVSLLVPSVRGVVGARRLRVPGQARRSPTRCGAEPRRKRAGPRPRAKTRARAARAPRRRPRGGSAGGRAGGRRGAARTRTSSGRSRKPPQSAGSGGSSP